MPRPRKQRVPDHGEDHAAQPGSWRRYRRYWMGVTGAALALRIALLLGYSGVVYPGDHGDLVSWGIQAIDRGVLTLYSESPAPQQLRKREGGEWRVITWDRSHLKCNYPPLALYLLYLSGAAFTALSPDRLINTMTSQISFSIWSMLGDLVVAAGCAAVVSRWRSARAVRWTYASALFAPPLWWESIVWGQTTSIVLAPAVWMLYAMLRQRWVWAGLLLGVALALKPQALLFAPLWGFALLTTRPFWRVLGGSAVAAAALLVLGLPFTIHGGWRWLEASYWYSLFGMFTDYTTLNAHNLWYIDVLLSDSLKATETWLGITKLVWGKVLLLAGMTVAFAIALWRWRCDLRGLVFWSALSLLLFVMLPTKVHERYLLLVLPFLGIAGALSWRFLPALALLTIVAMIQMTWPLWLKQWPGQTRSIEARVRHAYEQAKADPKTAGQAPPDFENALAQSLGNYRSSRAQSVGLEWTSTLLALAATAMTAAAFINSPVQARDTRNAAD